MIVADVCPNHDKDCQIKLIQFHIYYFQIVKKKAVDQIMIFVLTEVPCMKKFVVHPFEGKALLNHVIGTPEVTSEAACKIYCFIEVKCESYNFGPKEGGGRVCELSDSDAIRNPLDLITKQRFLYGETQVWKVRIYHAIQLKQ